MEGTGLQTSTAYHYISSLYLTPSCVLSFKNEIKTQNINSGKDL